MNRVAWRDIVHGIARVGHNLATKPPAPLYYFGDYINTPHAYKDLVKGIKASNIQRK